MIDRKARAVLAAAVFLALQLLITVPRVTRADYSAISGIDTVNVIAAAVIAPSGTFTQAKPFTNLGRSVNQSVQVQGVGTSPNYKVEILVCVDGSTYVKPDIGGTLGTFTDGNVHVVSVSTPVCVGSELKVTELGGSNSVTVTAWEISQ